MESSRGIAIAMTIATLLHVAVLAAPLKLDIKRAVRRDIEPLVVNLVPSPPAREQPPRPPRAEPAKVKPIVKAAPPKPKPPPATPVPFTTTTEGPSAIVSPELPRVAAVPPPTPDPAVAIDPPAPASAPAAPLVPPSFNAGYLHNPKPVYPAAARRFGEQGTVLLRVYVSATGAPERIQVHSSSGSVRLDQAATETVRGWKFIPAQRGNESVSAWVTVPIIFTLKD